MGHETRTLVTSTSLRAMEEDDDIIMIDPGPRAVLPVGSGHPQGSGPTKRPLFDNPLHAEASIKPPEKEPLLARPSPLSTHESTPLLQKPVSKESTSSIEERGLNTKYSQDSDSIMEENSDWSDEEAIIEGLPLSSLTTGLCYDTRMRYHCEVRPTADVHPEDPRRIYYIYKELCRAGLVDDPEASKPLVSRPLKRIHVRNASEEEIRLVHTTEHYTFVKSTKDMSDDMLNELEHTRDSIYFNSLTFASSLLSVGGAIETCMAVATRKVKNAIAVIRPPGHHAEHNKTMGFCLFNNVSIAAKVCQRELGEKCRKIMILDWDVHHGNGIQKAFYNDPNVLYISIHVYQDGKFYPGGDEGNWDYCGAGTGIGKNINIPWPSQGMGDGDYMYAFQQIIMPIASEFDPDLLIVASGFDAAAGDELGGCFVTPACYAHMTHMLMSLANGKVAVCLEGGYNFRSISKSALAVTKTLMGEPPDRLISTSASRPAIQIVRHVMLVQSKYWKSMYPKAFQQGEIWTDRVHDIVRAYQSKHLYDNYKLTNLYIYRNSISKSFENQVLTSANYDKAVPLLVIFHDPPEIMGISHPLTNKLEAHNCWLADVVKDYIEWALSKGYAVIDVNVPKYVTTAPLPGQYEQEDQSRPNATEELAGYLWDNYIEPNDATHIFFMGVGDAFFGVANLLINRESLYQRINSVISFVAENPVRAIASHTQAWLSRWYKDNSLVYVSHIHGVWNNVEGRRRPSKRYGRLIRSPKSGLTEMVVHHKTDVFNWIENRVVEDESEEEEGTSSIRSGDNQVHQGEAKQAEEGAAATATVAEIK